jgi:hypothetical protein
VPPPQLAADLQAIDTGQQDVEHDGIVVADVDPGQRLLAVRREVDGVAFFDEPPPQQLGQARFIFDDEDPHPKTLLLDWSAPDLIDIRDGA